MKKINKIISLVLILSLVFSLCACKSSVEEEGALAGDITLEQNEQNETPETDTPNEQTGNGNQTQTPGQTNTDGTVDNTQQNNQETKPDPENNTENGNTAPETSPETGNGGTEQEDDDDFDAYAAEPQFDTYVSNTFVPTGNHYVLTSETEKTQTFRGVFPVQQTGRLEYAFYFSNCVDSTWAGGDVAYRNMPTAGYEILSAAVMISKSPESTSVGRKTTVTFGNKKTRTVEPDEMFWSDPVMFNVADGEYLVFEWKVKYTSIPCNKINGVGYGYVSNDNGTTFVSASDGMPMPSMIGAKRDGVKSVAFIGDSITAGEGAGVHNGYVAQISNGLGKDVSVWNLGLGYARANDAVNSPAWMKKAKTADTVAICFGVNDINSGAYNVGTRTADQVIGDITTIAKEISDAGCKVIIISTPAYTYGDAARVQKWKDVVKGLEKLAKDSGYDYFDFGKCVTDPADNSTPIYGGHPNGEGCKVVASAFLKEYQNGTITFK